MFGKEGEKGIYQEMYPPNYAAILISMITSEEENLKSYFGRILYLFQAGLRERLLYEAKTKYNELRCKEAPLKLEVKREKAVEVTIFRMIIFMGHNYRVS